MKKQHLLFATFILAGSLTVSGQTPDTADSLSAQRTLTIDEVVVTGYGDFKKATYTGSASVLTTEKLEALPVVSVGQMIESNIPGISVVAGTSSQPGAKTTLRVRGIASMNASTEPLYVLDGVPIPSYDLSNFTSMSVSGRNGSY